MIPLLEINPNTEEINEFCCTHLCGMENINDSIWAIRHNSMESTENYIATVNENKTGEIKKYDLAFYATDLKYDGQHLWLCDRDSKKIKQMGDIVVPDKMNILPDNILKIYPNPSKDIIEVEISDNFNIIEIRITDISCRILKTILTDTSCNKYHINLSDFKKGLYYIQLMDNDKSVTRKIIKN
jgi:hypothetical protein